jgi:diamine N-acetyltransferase
VSKSSTQIVLRALEPEDIDLIYKWENDRTIWHVSNTIAPFSKFVLTKFIENSHLDIYQTHQLRLMIDLKTAEQTRTIGSIDLFDFEPYHLRAGVGILIGEPEDRGKGYAQVALNELIQYAFNVLQLKQIYCNIGVENKQSLAVFENCGFKKVGVKKSWIKTPKGFTDEYLLQRVNSNL